MLSVSMRCQMMGLPPQLQVYRMTYPASYLSSIGQEPQ